MASYTIAQLKTFVAGIPAGADNLLVEVPDNLVLPVVNNRSVGADGTLWYTVRGYWHVGTRTWEAVN